MRTEYRLKDQVAIVVGAGQTPGETMGNGRATALRFAEEGARLVLADRDEESLAESAKQAQALGAPVLQVVVDITSEDDNERLISAAAAHYGQIDILHNNVGIGTGDRGPTSLPLEVWQRIFDVNITGPFLTCKHVLPVMRRQKNGGCIVNISSMAAVAATSMTAYKASKAALNAFTQQLAAGNARHGIRVNGIMPGLMETPMAVDAPARALGVDREAYAQGRHDRVPLRGRMGSAWDVANAALFLASAEARFITGVILPVDGGSSVH
jgi:NAD(P)-dependent dehydrogenase (short-subunit alcohol dehydrogenase family)